MTNVQKLECSQVFGQTVVLKGCSLCGVTGDTTAQAFGKFVHKYETNYKVYLAPSAPLRSCIADVCSETMSLSSDFDMRFKLRSVWTMQFFYLYSSSLSGFFSLSWKWFYVSVQNITKLLNICTITDNIPYNNYDYHIT